MSSQIVTRFSSLKSIELPCFETVAHPGKQRTTNVTNCTALARINSSFIAHKYLYISILLLVSLTMFLVEVATEEVVL